MQRSMISNTYRYKTLFLVTVFVSFVAAIALGFGLPTDHNCIIIPVDPFAIHGITQAVVSICAVDVIMFWLLTIPLSRALNIGLAFAVFFIRGFVIGNCMGIISANSVTFDTVILFCAYCAVTLLMAMYDSFLNFNERENLLFRVLSCFIVTGAVVVIKLSTMLVIN